MIVGIGDRVRDCDMRYPIGGQFSFSNRTRAISEASFRWSLTALAAAAASLLQIASQILAIWAGPEIRRSVVAKVSARRREILPFRR